MLLELDSFIDFLKKDTLASLLQWNSVANSWGGEYDSLDFRSTNPSLSAWTNKNPFIYNHWSDIYMADVLTGYVYIAKRVNIPPLYYIYLQPDAHSKIRRLNCDSPTVKELYDLVQQQCETSSDDLLNFIDAFNNSHVDI